MRAPGCVPSVPATRPSLLCSVACSARTRPGSATHCPRRAKAVVEDKPVKPKKVAAVVDPDEADLPEDVIDADADDDEEEDVIEDTSELGEDDDDVAEVIEKVDDEGDR